jgi:hypothetical protein
MRPIFGEQNLVNLSENIHRSDEVFDLVLDRLQATDFMLQKFTLTCDEKAFKKRLIAAGRPKDRIPRCLESLHLCETTDTVRIDTTEKTVVEVAEILYNLMSVESQREHRKSLHREL